MRVAESVSLLNRDKFTFIHYHDFFRILPFFNLHSLSLSRYFFLLFLIRVFQSDERRKAGRPKLRWLDCTENDLESMRVKRWRKKAEDRSGLTF